MTLNSSGTLYVVATPIGNLDDFSPRARQVLSAVMLIAAEDTRHTKELLSHCGISTPLLALHEYNEAAQVEKLLDRLRQGASVALVSDAGTPLISDPGFRLVAAVRAAGISASPVPGPCAAIAALSVAGLPSDRFCFEGFLPAKPAARRLRLQALAAEPRTLVFYESSHRISEMLADAADTFGAGREATLARELTKRYETVLHGTLGEIRQRVGADPDRRRGEFVIVIAGNTEEMAAAIAQGRRAFALLRQHLPPSQAARLAAELSGAPRQRLYAGSGNPVDEDMR